jgi:glycosyltransferase involved in cell wall biosynthesis
MLTALRVAVVTTSYPASAGDPSGHFVQAEARQLARGAEVTVITAASAGSRPGATREADGIVVRRVGGGSAFGWPGVAARLRAGPWRAVDAGLWVYRVRALLRRDQPFDRVVAHWAVPCAVPAATGLTAALEVVSHGADVRALVGAPGVVRRALVESILASASSWRFVSSGLRDDLAAALDRRGRDRLERLATVAAAAIELPDVRDRVAALGAREGLADGALLLVCVGRLVEGKRFDRALEHAAREASAAPSGARVVVVGDGPERGRLERRARELRLDARFVGKVGREEALAWIAVSTALLHASREEGLSTVVREAVAMGVRVDVVA